MTRSYKRLMECGCILMPAGLVSGTRVLPEVQMVGIWAIQPSRSDNGYHGQKVNTVFV